VVIASYLDTSAAMKLLVEEHESFVLRDELASSGGRRRLMASWLLHTELHCAAGRRSDVIDAANVQRILSRTLLVDVSRGDLVSAGTHRPLRAQDAIHLATALRLGVDEIITYDEELAAAARSAGIAVLSPA